MQTDTQVRTTIAYADILRMVAGEYPNSTALLGALGAVWDKYPKLIPFGYGPQDAMFAGRQDGHVVFHREGITVSMPNEYATTDGDVV